MRHNTNIYSEELNSQKQTKKRDKKLMQIFKTRAKLEEELERCEDPEERKRLKTGLRILERGCESLENINAHYLACGDQHI